MKYTKGKITKLLVDFFQEDYKRINHALEVLRVSEELLANYNDYDHNIVIACALLHDVGIKPSEKELGYNNGKTQELYGPPIAIKLLNSISFPKEKTEIVSQIIGNHHSVSRYDYIELEILKKADRTINLMDKDT